MKKIIILSTLAVATVGGGATAAVILNNQSNNQEPAQNIVVVSPIDESSKTEDPIKTEQPQEEQTAVEPIVSPGPYVEPVIEPQAPQEPEICEYEQKYGGMTDFEALVAYIDELYPGWSVNQRVRDHEYISVDQLYKRVPITNPAQDYDELRGYAPIYEDHMVELMDLKAACK